jgi:HrpA-like RNA helicase
MNTRSRKDEREKIDELEVIPILASEVSQVRGRAGKSLEDISYHEPK